MNFFSDVLKCIVYEGIEENFEQKLLLFEQLRFVFSFSVCSYFSRHRVAAIAQDCRWLWAVRFLLKHLVFD